MPLGGSTVGAAAAMRTHDKIPGTLVEMPQVAGDSEEVRQAYAKAFARSCGVELTDKDFVTIAMKSPTDPLLVANLRAECFQILRKDIAQRDAQSPALGEIDALVARIPEDVDRAYAAARARVEASPAIHFKAPLDKIPLPALSAAIDEARLSNSARQACGTFDRPMPSNQAQWNAARSGLDDHRLCLDRLESRAESAVVQAAMGHHTDSSDFDADEAMALLTGSARYRCSVHASRACLPDASWDRVAAVATPANIAVLEKARNDQRNRSGDIDTLRAEANDWVRRFNAHLEQREASGARSSGGAGGYVPAPSIDPQTVRRAYGSSAAGIQ